MWLLNTTTFKFHEFLGEDRPPYAVLSHVWSEEEVTRQQFLGEDHKKTYGYWKIEQLCRLALAIGDGGENQSLQWAWIDTVCINKNSSAELSEAINSMFEWYRNAAVCFVFLPDVHPMQNVSQPTELMTATPFLEKEFLDSKWFKRGWTLQELIAPRRVVFFNSGFSIVGVNDKTSKSRFRPDLIKEIERASNVSQTILTSDERALRRVCVAQRMSWASSRQTTRPEDVAYCLLGIFDVNMPLLYGEGPIKAFRRLQREIIANSTDESIFAWKANPDAPSIWTDLLASTPAAFEECHTMRIKYRSKERQTYAITQRGLELSLPIDRPLSKVPEGMWLILYPLSCVFEPESSIFPRYCVLKIWVNNRPDVGYTYAGGYRRAWRSGLLLLPPADLNQFKVPSWQDDFTLVENTWIKDFIQPLPDMDTFTEVAPYNVCSGEPKKKRTLWQKLVEPWRQNDARRLNLYFTAPSSLLDTPLGVLASTCGARPWVDREGDRERPRELRTKKLSPGSYILAT